MSTLGYLAAALGTTLAAWANLALLWWRAQSMDGAATLDARLRRAAPRILLASIVMGLAVWAATFALETWFAHHTLRYLALLILVGFGAVIYALCVIALGGIRPSDLKAALRRG